MIFSSAIEAEGVMKAPKLLQLSGANALVTSINIPPNSDALVKRHVNSGAVFYRIITVSEMHNTETGTLLTSLLKMREIGCSPLQSVLLLDATRTILEYEPYMEKIDAWTSCGGMYIDTLGRVPLYYLMWRDQHPLSLETKNLYPVYKSADMSFVTDYRATLATMPGIGTSGAEKLKKIMVDQNLGDELIQALVYITDWNATRKSQGKWREVRDGVRKWIGIPDEFDLDLKFTGSDGD